MACAKRTLTLHERLAAKVPQTAPWWCQRLSATLVPWSGMHKEWISHPETSPAGWTLWRRCVLTVYCKGWRWGFAYDTSANVRPNFWPLQRHRGNGSRGGQPIGFVVAARVVARLHIATGEWHCAENTHTWTCLAQVLCVRPLLTLQIKQAVSLPQLGQAVGTRRHGF